MDWDDPDGVSRDFPLSPGQASLRVTRLATSGVLMLESSELDVGLTASQGDAAAKKVTPVIGCCRRPSGAIQQAKNISF